MSEEHIGKICDLVCNSRETDESKIFENDAFGYQKIIVERPLRLKCKFSRKSVEALRFYSGDIEARKAIFQEFGEEVYKSVGKKVKEIKDLLSFEDEDGDQKFKFDLNEKKLEKLLKEKNWNEDKKLLEIARDVFSVIGEQEFLDYNLFVQKIESAVKKSMLVASAAQIKTLARAMSVVDETACPVVKKIHKPGKITADPLYGLFEIEKDGKKLIVEYEPDTSLRDSEQVPLQEEGGIESFVKREVLPYVVDAWVDAEKTQIGYEISFTRHFYKPARMRTLEEIKADIFALEKETEGLLEEIVGEVDA